MESGMQMLSDAMRVKLHKTDVITNNIANVNTTGFKGSDISTYTDYAGEINPDIDDGMARKETALNSAIPIITSTHIDHKPGGLKMTGNELDFNISDPNMMFMIQLENGDTGYTRDGSFKISNEMLVNGDGNPVLDSGGAPIEVSNKEQIQPGLAIVDFKNIESRGGNIFVTKNNENLATVENASEYTLQGALETSNVNIVKAMTDLITAHREYEQMSKFSKSADELNKEATSQIGNVRG
jgi:flagellar basal-body rod protein FlgF